MISESGRMGTIPTGRRIRLSSTLLIQEQTAAHRRFNPVLGCPGSPYGIRT